MKHKKKIITGLVLIGGITSLLLFFSVGKAKTIYKEAPVTIDIPQMYETNIVWPVAAKDKKTAGEASGVAVDSKDNIYYLHRATATYGNDEVINKDTVVVLDAQTKEVRDTWGKGLFKSPHGLEIDSEDNVWITDISQNKIYKFSPEGKLLDTFGSDYPFYMEAALRIRNVLPKFPTGMDEYTFARPTDVTVLKDGSFVVSDGYRNRRIVKFDQNGKFIWEKNLLGNKDGEFNLPHGISHDENGNLYVADRNNARIQVFDKDGNFLDSWNSKELGRPFGVEVGDDGNVYVADGGNSLYPEGGKGSHQVVVLNTKGEVIQRFGSWGENKGQLKIPHDIAVNSKGDIYVAELENERLQEFKKKD